MPNEFLVHPGDLITADLWNKLLSSIDSVNARIDANEARVVPDVVGDLLGTARDEIARARLDLQNVLDAEGTRVDLADATLAERIVLAQMPSPDALVRIGRRVTLLITAPKVKKANAPDLTAVNVADGGTAQVNKGLELIGAAFTGKIGVSIRNTALAADQFTVDSATKITIPKVPPFEGAPAPGATKPIPITVSNEFGNDSFTVNFSEPQIVVAAPVITNVRFRDKRSFSILGASLNPPIQDVRVTILNDDVRFRPVSDQQIDAEVNDQVERMFEKIDDRTFEMLLEIDKRDLFLVDTVQLAPDFGRPPKGGGGPFRPGDETGRTGSKVRLKTRKQTVKLFLLLAPALARAVVTAREVRVTPALDSIEVTAGRTNFTVSLDKLFDVEVAVRAGDKSDSFLLKVGEVG